MSHPLTRWAWTVRLPATEKLLLLALADCCNGAQRTHTCWPSMAHLAEATGLSVRTLQRALRELETRCLVNVELGNGRRSTTYTLACTDSPNGRLDLGDPTRGDTVSPQGRQADTPGATRRRPKGDTQTPQGRQPDAQGRQADTRTENEPGMEQGEGIPLSMAALNWRETAAELRPDITDPAPAWAKFQAFQGTATRSPTEWAALWRLWITRERQTAASACSQAGAQPSPPATADSECAADIREITADIAALRLLARHDPNGHHARKITALSARLESLRSAPCTA